MAEVVVARVRRIGGTGGSGPLGVDIGNLADRTIGIDVDADSANDFAAWGFDGRACELFEPC